ncbi:MAG: class D sortase [Oscillospiraceae bacterium]|nr:class D sortase [Oscillospiraceae bacterium]
MAEEKTAKQRSSLPAYLLTPLLLLLLTGGILVLCYSLAPVHYVQKYLNIAFMDNLKTTGTTDGLHIKENEIETVKKPDADTYEEGKINYPVFGEQYAVLSAESIGLTVGVYYGVNAELLDRGACQSSQSAIIGDHGNTVIDAHVTTYFSELSKLKPGDEVELFTNYGQFTYKVKEQISFDKEDKHWLAVSKDDRLTLYTCAPQVIGSADKRIGVWCEPVSRKFNAPADAK